MKSPHVDYFCRTLDETEERLVRQRQRLTPAPRAFLLCFATGVLVLLLVVGGISRAEAWRYSSFYPSETIRDVVPNVKQQSLRRSMSEHPRIGQRLFPHVPTTRLSQDKEVAALGALQSFKGIRSQNYIEHEGVPDDNVLAWTLHSMVLPMIVISSAIGCFLVFCIARNRSVSLGNGTCVQWGKKLMGHRTVKSQNCPGVNIGNEELNDALKARDTPKGK